MQQKEQRRQSTKELSHDETTENKEEKTVIPTHPPQNSLFFNHVDIPYGTNLENVSLEDILEIVTGGYVKNCGPLNTLCLEANFYQFWTKEYVQHLGDYLVQRSQHKKTIIVDIGAGDGLLIQSLKDYIGYTHQITHNSKRKKTTIQTTQNDNLPTLVATDDMSWGIFTKARVEKLSVVQALSKYTNKVDKESNNDDSNQQNDGSFDQIIVLCSWMPMGQDWTAMFREYNVDEYILIGEADDGSCGHNWLTWGNPIFREEQSSSRSTLDKTSIHTPYEEDRYQRWDMDVLKPFQFSSFDCTVSKSSKSVSFRKV